MPSSTGVSNIHRELSSVEHYLIFDSDINGGHGPKIGIHNGGSNVITFREFIPAGRISAVD